MPPSPHACANVREARILIIDDDPVVVAAFRDYLVEQGYRVETAFNGGDGLMHVAQGRPDVTLLDIRMPGLDGFAVLDEIRSTDPSIPVIMVTGDLDVGLAQTALRKGAAGYVTKPCNMNDLERTILGALVRTANPHRAGRDTPGGGQPESWERLGHALGQTAQRISASSDCPLRDRLEFAFAAAQDAARANDLAGADTQLALVEVLLRVAVELGDLSLADMLPLEAALVGAREALAARSATVADERG